jgi:hypothetical protein
MSPNLGSPTSKLSSLVSSPKNNPILIQRNSLIAQQNHEDPQKYPGPKLTEQVHDANRADSRQMERLSKIKKKQQRTAHYMTDEDHFKRETMNLKNTMIKV